MGEDQLTLAIRRFCHGTVMLAPSILNFCCSFLKPKTLTTKAKHQPKDPTPLNQNPRAANPETAEAEGNAMPVICLRHAGSMEDDRHTGDGSTKDSVTRTKPA